MFIVQIFLSLSIQEHFFVMFANPSRPGPGTGPKLGPTLSVCDNCVNSSSCREERGTEDDEEDDDDDDEDDNDDHDHEREDDGNGDDSEDDEENQVVPWSSTPSPPCFQALLITVMNFQADLWQ
ncbi:hypothetical protein OIU78_000185 [Salix suchowensis]|nr:hypothetical protein OIU78_000185 [Salix suchowensis]